MPLKNLESHCDHDCIDLEMYKIFIFKLLNNYFSGIIFAFPTHTIDSNQVKLKCL